MNGVWEMHGGRRSAWREVFTAEPGNAPRLVEIIRGTQCRETHSRTEQ